MYDNFFQFYKKKLKKKLKFMGFDIKIKKFNFPLIQNIIQHEYKTKQLLLTIGKWYRSSIFLSINTSFTKLDLNDLNLDIQEYSTYLSEGIMFLNLYDVNGCNTLIECIYTKTPLIINKLPTLIEYLGEDYPFWWDGNYNVDKYFDPILISECITYMSHINITKNQDFIDLNNNYINYLRSLYLIS